MAESAAFKATIVRAASTAFAERGYAQTTLDIVARSVGLTRTGILHHFPSKESLFRAVLDQERTWAEGQIDVPPRPGPLGPIRELEVFLGAPRRATTPLRLIHVLEGEALAGNAVAAQYVTERMGYVQAEIRRRLERCWDAGELAADADLAVLTTVIAATINGLQKLWLLHPRTDQRPAFQRFVDLLTTD
ncbi:TetR family transcriptional regulator [Actinoplanes sp. NPDC026619]|uniref:TetR family transcriptional regulator n=1 Tax=Actinoplanes sp. NPDC026619 TaxID=3155798 RepID=UPI0033DD10B8